MDTEINILARSPKTANLFVTTWLDVFYEAQGTGSPVGKTDYLLCDTVLPDDWNAVTDYIYAIDACSPGECYQGGTDSFSRYAGVSYVCLISNTNKRPDLNPTYWATFHPPLLDEYRQERARFEFDGSSYDPETGLNVKAFCSSTVYEINFDRCVKLYDVLKELLYVVDPTINIDETGANEYSSYLNSGSSPSDGELANLLIADKSDIKRYASSNPASFEYMKLKRILKLYKDIFNLDWEIDDSNYFKLRHPSEISRTLPTPAINYPEHYLRSFKNRNWTQGFTRYKHITEKVLNKERWEFENSPTLDFKGLPIEYDNEHTEEIKYNLEDVNNDVSEVTRANNDGVSDSGFVIFATTFNGTSYDIVNKNGIRVSYVLYNGKLATTRLISEHHTTGDRPYAKGEVNGVPGVTLVKKNDKEVENLLAPYEDLNVLDFNSLVETDLADVRLDDVALKFDGSLTKIKGSWL